MDIGGQGNYQQVMSLNGRKQPVIQDYDPLNPAIFGDQVTEAAIEAGAGHLLREERTPKAASQTTPVYRPTLTAKTELHTPRPPKKPAKTAKAASSIAEGKGEEETETDDLSPRTLQGQTSSGQATTEAETSQGSAQQSAPIGTDVSVNYNKLHAELFQDLTQDSVLPSSIQITRDEVEIIDTLYPDATYSQRNNSESLLKLAQDRLTKGLAREALFEVTPGHPESRADRHLRCSLWKLMKHALRNYQYLYEGLFYGDVRKLFFRALTVSDQSYHSNICKVLDEMSTFTKTRDMSFNTWYTKITKMFDFLHMTGNTISEPMKITHLCRSIKTDPRYTKRARKVLESDNLTLML